MTLTVHTNNVTRDVIYGHELTEKERAEFDYLDWSQPDGDGWTHSFVRYNGQLYDLSEFMRTSELLSPEMQNWDGYMSDSYFSGTLIRYAREDDRLDPERVVVGWYCS